MRSRIFYFGRVQGVGFRWNVKEIVKILKKEYDEKEIKLEDETRSFIEDCIETGILIYEK